MFITTFKESGTLRFLFAVGMILFVSVLSGSVFAESEGTIGSVAKSVTKTFEQIAQLITATSYIAGLGFAIGAVLKFKQHKDNPTQIPIGTPVALLFVAAALLFLPSIMETAGATLFGEKAAISGVAGVTDVGEAYTK